jgi:hypothetical protein
MNETGISNSLSLVGGLGFYNISIFFIKFLIVSILIYIFFRLILKLINYIAFIIIVNNLIDAGFFTAEQIKKYVKKNKEDDRDIRDKYQERKKAIEKIQEKKQSLGLVVDEGITEDEIENAISGGIEVLGGKNQDKQDDIKVVGTNLKIYGKHTAKFVQKFLGKMQNMTPELLNSMKNGRYFRTLVEMKRGTLGMSQSNQQDKIKDREM